MTTTLDAVKSKKQNPVAEETAAKEQVRLARDQGLSLTGPDGLLKQFTETVLDTALNEEMTEHLRHETHQADPERDSANVRNGPRPEDGIDRSDRPGHDRGSERPGWVV